MKQGRRGHTDLKCDNTFSHDHLRISFTTLSLDFIDIDAYCMLWPLDKIFIFPKEEGHSYKDHFSWTLPNSNKYVFERLDKWNTNNRTDTAHTLHLSVPWMNNCHKKIFWIGPIHTVNKKINQWQRQFPSSWLLVLFLWW